MCSVNLDEVFLKLQVRACSVAVSWTSRNSDSGNREPNEDCSPNDPCPEAMVSSHQSGILNNSGVEEYPHMVTGAQKEICNRLHMIREEVPSYSPGISSGSQKNARSTSQVQFRSEKNRAIIGADQIIFALQQLVTNNISAIFNNKINRISKFPKSLTTTMPTFDGKSENIELFGDLFQTSLKIHNQLTEEDKMNYFHSLIPAMHYRHSKTSPAPIEKIWEEF